MASKASGTRSHHSPTDAAHALDVVGFVVALAVAVGRLSASGMAQGWPVVALSAAAQRLGLVDRLSGDGINAATLYHLRADMDGAGVSDFSGYIAVFVGMLLLSLSPLLLVRVRRFQHPRGGGAVFAGFVGMLLVGIAASPLYRDGKRLYYQLRPVDYATVVPEYQVPQQPLQKRKNIVWIYGESLERTYFDEQVFPGLMPNLRALATEAVDVRNLASTEGSGWTIAGMVASMCGVPLTTAPGDENSMDRMGMFLPEARCLGDYLKDQGYRNHYVGGADASFAGKGRFLSSHGFDVVHDVHHFHDKGVAQKHFSAWGVHDDVLLDDAWDSFQTLSRAGQPFMLTTLTMDTHHPPATCRWHARVSTTTAHWAISACCTPSSAATV